MPFDFDPQRYPTTPGCYLMRDAGGRVIYVGKAKHLRRRLASYFRPNQARKTRRDHRMDRLVAAVAAIDVILVNNEMESLVLENNLIKHHHPRFNRMLMPDDTGYHYIVLTDEPLPRLLPYRKQRVNKALAGKDVEQRLGPYLSRESRDGLLTYVADHFGLRTCQPLGSRVCLRYHLKACGGVCEKRVSADEYAVAVQEALAFLARPHAKLVADMRAEMAACAERLEFERAQRIKEQMLALEATLQPQIVERDVDHDQDVVYFGPDEARWILVATFRKGALLAVTFCPLETTTAYPQACRDFLVARYARSGPEEVLCNAPEEALMAFAALGNKRCVRVPTGDVECELLALCCLNYEYQVKASGYTDEHGTHGFSKGKKSVESVKSVYNNCVGFSRQTMVEVLIVEQLPTATQYNQLRAAVGWGVYEAAVIERALPNTLYCLCAFVAEELVGMARVIGDGAMVYYIQDVIVLPAYQRQGIGAQMMDRVMAYIRIHASHNTIIGLMAACGKEPFYEKYGFTRRPTERLGAGMTMFWK